MARRTDCVLWPDCSCGYAWRRWQTVCEQEEWSPGRLGLDCAEIEIRNMLDCVSRRCPDADFRKHATVQLMHPVFGGVE